MQDTIELIGHELGIHYKTGESLSKAREHKGDLAHIWVVDEIGASMIMIRVTKDKRIVVVNQKP